MRGLGAVHEGAARHRAHLVGVVLACVLGLGEVVQDAIDIGLGSGGSLFRLGGHGLCAGQLLAGGGELDLQVVELVLGPGDVALDLGDATLDLRDGVAGALDSSLFLRGQLVAGLDPRALGVGQLARILDALELGVGEVAGVGLGGHLERQEQDDGEDGNERQAGRGHRATCLRVDRRCADAGGPWQPRENATGPNGTGSVAGVGGVEMSTRW